MNNNANKKATQKGSKPTKGRMSKLSAAMSRSMTTGIPQVVGNPVSDGRIRVRHREYVQDVLGSVAYGVTTLSINPGLSSLFTWLAPIAVQYESYLFRNLSFEFVTQKGSATVGSIMLAVDYDASDSAPVNKQQLMSYHDSVRSAVWDECCFKCDSRDLQKFGVQRYLRYGALPANADVKTYDIGNLHVATQGCADATAIGELYVSYDVELITPQTDVGGATLAVSAKVVGAGTVNLANMFGTVSGTITGGLNCTAAGGTLTFNRVGQYLVGMDVSGTGIASAPGLTGTATSTLLNANINAAQTGSTSIYRVQVNNIGETMILDHTGHATTLTASVTRIGPYSYSLA